jgi:hypothetical protein
MNNTHTRLIQRSLGDVAPLLESLAGPHDRLWPSDRWPPIRLDRGLAVGSKGGHGTILYEVVDHEPGRSVTFRFDPRIGIVGTHTFSIADHGVGGTELRHEIAGTLTGPMRLMWPLVVRPLHDALLEDALDNAEAALANRPVNRRRFGPSVRLLRYAVRPCRPDRTGALVGTGAATILAALGVIHLAWGMGVTYPATDGVALARTVVGGDAFPSPAACGAVAGLLAAATALVAGRARPGSRVAHLVPPPIAALGTATVGGVLALRGAGGLLTSALGAPSTTDRFRVLNLALYSPLCLALAAAIHRMERSPEQGR